MLENKFSAKMGNQVQNDAIRQIRSNSTHPVTVSLSACNQYRVSGGEACGFAAIASLERLKNAKGFFNNSHLIEQCEALQLIAFFSFFGSFLSLLPAIKEKETNIIRKQGLL